MTKDGKVDKRYRPAGTPKGSKAVAQLRHLPKFQVQKLFEWGHSEQDICEFFKISINTWTAWKTEVEPFGQQVREWQELSVQSVKRALFRVAQGKQKTLKRKIVTNPDGEEQLTIEEGVLAPSVEAAKFILKNKAKDEFTDRVQVDHSFTEIKIVSSIDDDDEGEEDGK